MTGLRKLDAREYFDWRKRLNHFQYGENWVLYTYEKCVCEKYECYETYRVISGFVEDKPILVHKVNLEDGCNDYYGNIEKLDTEMSLYYIAQLVEAGEL